MIASAASSSYERAGLRAGSGQNDIHGVTRAGGSAAAASLAARWQ